MSIQRYITMPLVLALFLTAFLAAPPAEADTKVIGGEMEYVFEVHSSNKELLDSFYEYENASNSQEVIERGDGFITVRTRADLSFFRNSVPFPVGDRYGKERFAEELDYSTSRKGIEIRRSPGGETTTREFVQKTPMSESEQEFLRRRARMITDGARYQWDAVERIMTHIRKHVDYRLNVSSNPVRVLQSGLAYCTGYANAAALLLRVLGIPAKVVESYIPPGHMWGYGQGGSGSFHAHVEVYYEDAGWVSYDPQATVHYVDPFHIVRFPRKRLRLVEKSQVDGRILLDRLREPGNTNNFFKRRTEEEQKTPILTGRIYDRKGELVTDSFRNGQWVYRRTGNASGEGVRILSNGRFGISPPPGEGRVEFTYKDGNGGWLAQQVDFRQNRRIERTYRLDDPARGYTIDLQDRETLYVWRRDQQGRWRVNSVQAGPEGTVFLAANQGEWTVSTEKDAFAVKRRLAVAELEKGRTYRIEDLSRNLDPQSFYVRGIMPREELRNTRAVVYRTDGRRFPEVDVPEGRQFLIPVPDGSFDRILLLSDRLLAIKAVELTDRGKPAELDFRKNMTTFRIDTGARGGTMYLAKQQQGRYMVLHKMAVQRGQQYRVMLHTALLDGSEQYAVIPAGGQPIPLKKEGGRSITLE